MNKFAYGGRVRECAHVLVLVRIIIFLCEFVHVHLVYVCAYVCVRVCTLAHTIRDTCIASIANVMLFTDFTKERISLKVI